MGVERECAALWRSRGCTTTLVRPSLSACGGCIMEEVAAAGTDRIEKTDDYASVGVSRRAHGLAAIAPTARWIEWWNDRAHKRPKERKNSMGVPSGGIING